MLNRTAVAQVTSLIFQGQVYDAWYAANRKANRFFVLNIKKVMGDLNLEHTKAGPYFTAAVEIIDRETQWKLQYAFEYGCSHTSIYPDKVGTSKTFAHAVTIIVAMDAYARKHRPNYNVYDYLRIIPAQYFVDQLDKDRLDALAKTYDALSLEDKVQKFGEDGALSFTDLCLKRIGQTIGKGLLYQMVSGLCVTEFVAQALMSFINSNFPAQLHVGPVLPAGAEEAINQKLGRKNAATELRVPKIRKLEELSPPYLA
jgi:hypothetical protein